MAHCEETLYLRWPPNGTIVSTYLFKTIYLFKNISVLRYFYLSDSTTEVKYVGSMISILEVVEQLM